jgi:hypothetical protein
MELHSEAKVYGTSKSKPEGRVKRVVNERVKTSSMSGIYLSV